MYIRRFTYKKEDVGCKLCTEFRGRKKCPHKICPYITERIEAGAVTYQEAVNAMVHSGCQLIRRLPKLMQTYSGSFWLDDRHKSRMEFFNTRIRDLILLTIAFLFSPMGLPMIAVWILSVLQGMSGMLKSI